MIVEWLSEMDNRIWLGLVLSVVAAVVGLCWRRSLEAQRADHQRILQLNWNAYMASLEEQQRAGAEATRRWHAAGQALQDMARTWRSLTRARERQELGRLRQELDRMAEQVERATESAPSESGVRARPGGEAVEQPTRAAC